MATYKVTVTFSHVNNRPEDAFVNDFVVMDPTGQVDVEGGPLVVTQALAQLYNEQHLVLGDMTSINDYLAECVSRAANAVSVKLYDITAQLDGDPVGSPDYVDSFTLDPYAGAGDLPAEVSACVTLRGLGWQGQAINVPAGAIGPQGDVRPRQRRSGRVFLPPLTTGAITKDASTKIIRFHPAFRGTILASFAATQTALDVGVMSLGVWSRADALVAALEHVQVDDAPDTIRKRGQDATIREQQYVFTG